MVCVTFILAVAWFCLLLSSALFVTFATVTFRRGTLDFITQALTITGLILILVSALTGNLTFHLRP